MKKIIVLSVEQRENFERFLGLCDYYANSYFWTVKGNAAKRRYLEERDSMSYTTMVDGIEYEVDFSVEISCKNYYVYKSVYRDGTKTNAKVIRTLLEKDTSSKPTADKQ
ncbi:MAG: hypothetical protein EOM28_03190 [Clostridia bacterium]|nr:hypothetical protein [Clostridia bacterium]